MTAKVTLGQLLDLIDRQRDEDCTIKIMKEGVCLCSGMTCWEGWKFLENRIVEFIEAEDTGCFAIWLEDLGDK
jgi:hypothetical protein